MQPFFTGFCFAWAEWIQPSISGIPKWREIQNRDWKLHSGNYASVNILLMAQPYHILPKTGSSMAEEWLEIGCEHQANSRFDQAVRAYENGLRLEPNHGPITNNLGVLAAQQSKPDVAIRNLERSLLFDDKNATTWYNLALAYLEGDRVDEGVVAIEKSLAIGEGADALCAYGMILTSAGRSEEAIRMYDKALGYDPKHHLSSYNSIFIRTLVESKPKENLEVRQRWYRNFKYTGPKKPHLNDKSPDRKLKVGYVGGDFKMHSAAFIFGAVVLNHGDQIEPYCYQTLTHSPEDHLTKQFMAKTTFRDIQNLDDEQSDEMIRKDGIDILVDLGGFTGGNRLTLFTRKPAPIQVTAWGFAHGTGVPEIDYFFACPVGVPNDERQYFVEKIWDLPAVVTYLPPEYKQSGISPAPFKKNDVFTFGVYGRFEKYSQKSLETYSQILKNVPNSRIIFRDRNMQRPCSIKHVRKAFNGDDRRVLFSSWGQSHPEHLLSYQDVDLILDTFPHSGGLTALEEIHMGVPILTLRNGQVGGRSTAVALTSMGRTDWIANSVEEFIEKGIKLPEKQKELADARHTLREEFLNAPICKDYAKRVDEAYRGMWHKWIT